jgi:hypothetical protein
MSLWAMWQVRMLEGLDHPNIVELEEWFMQKDGTELYVGARAVLRAGLCFPQLRC